MDNVPAVVGVTLTGVAMLGGLMLYVIRGEITKATKYLQPRNGGEGWSDVHDKVTILVNRQGDAVRDLRYLRERLENHIDIAERRFDVIDARLNNGGPHADHSR